MKPAPRQLTHNGETLSILQWAAKTGLDAGLIRKRIKAGWTNEYILNPEKHPHAKKRRADLRPKKRKSDIDRSFNRLLFSIDMALREFKQQIEEIENDDTGGGLKLSKNRL
jgi:hypothetical protein